MKKLLVAVLVVVAAVILFRAISRLASSPAAPKPAPQSEARLGPADIYPDAARTPGEANPDITPENVGQTICNPAWSTRLVRPSAHYTSSLKMQQLREYGYADLNPRDYEEDHLIPLEIGGHPSDPKNLWPEPYETSIPDGGARFKDKVENYLHEQVCAGNISLREAQQEIAADWYRVYATRVAH